MHNSKYREAAQAHIPHWGWRMSNFVLSEPLKPLQESFRWSMVRTSNMLHLPAWIALEATREQLWKDHASVKSGGTIDPDLNQYSDTEITAEMASEFNRLVNEYRECPDDEHIRLFDEIGIAFIERRLADSKAISLGLKSLYESVILDSWSAFEILLRDLWVSVLDQSTVIATRVHTSGSLRNPSKKVVPTGDLSKYGSFVLEMRQASFQKLEDIRLYYGAAFGEKAVDLFDTVEDGYIKVLNAFRNVLLHNRGNLDLGFRQQVGKFTEFYLNLADGAELEVNGAQATRMRTVAMELGKELLQLSDRALRGEPI